MPGTESALRPGTYAEFFPAADPCAVTLVARTKLPRRDTQTHILYAHTPGFQQILAVYKTAWEDFVAKNGDPFKIERPQIIEDPAFMLLPDHELPANELVKRRLARAVSTAA